MQSSRYQEPMVRARPLMGTLFEIDASPEAIATGFQMAERMEYALSKFNPQSLVYKQGSISEEFQPLFDLAGHLQRESGGAFEFETNDQMDLSGIAKGWIADRVAEAVARDEETVTVNAGGDLRWIGGTGRKVALRAARVLRPLQLERLALASSMVASEHPSTVYHKSLRRGLAPQDLICAMADECAVADAFTKILMFADVSKIQKLTEIWRVQGLVLNPDGEVKEIWPSYEAISTL